MKIHQVDKQADWEKLAPAQRNVWQRTAAKTKGYAAPANVVSVVGLLLVLEGLSVLASGNFWRGIVLLAFGRVADVLDGYVADKTGTKSPLGEALDAGFDKIAALAALFLFMKNGLLPAVPGALIALQMLSNVALTLFAWSRQRKLHPNLSGKLAATMAWSALLLYPVAWFAARNRMPVVRFCALTVADVSMVAFVVLALLTTRSYVRMVRGRADELPVPQSTE
jgi:phosphatidylglycerophosphate synthase